VSLTSSARSEDRQPMRQELQGADTCTVKRNGYEWTCIIATRLWSLEGCGNRLELTGIRSLKTPGPGAVAHMSLHQNLTMSKSEPDINRRTAMEPRFSPGDRLSVFVWRPTQRSGVNRQRRVGEGHIWGALSRVNAFLQFYFVAPQEPQKSAVFSPFDTLTDGLSHRIFNRYGGFWGVNHGFESHVRRSNLEITA